MLAFTGGADSRDYGMSKRENSSITKKAHIKKYESTVLACVYHNQYIISLNRALLKRVRYLNHVIPTV